MVQAMIKISDEANQVINIIKAKHNLKDKSQAIEVLAQEYAHKVLEPSLRPSFVKKMKKRSQEETVEVADFNKHFKV